MNTVENFIKGSSLVAAFPTLLYVGIFQMKNRKELLKKASSIELQNFLSIPFESIVVGILVAYGIAFTIMKRNIDEEKDSKSKKLIKVMSHGAILGLVLSIFGRFYFDLPVKMFGIPKSQASKVHITAFILYSVIFLNIYFIKSNIKEPKEVQK